MCKRGESLGIIYFSFPSLLGKLLQLGQMWSGQSMNAGVQFPLQPILWQRIQWIGICYKVSSAYTIRGNTKLPFRSCKLSSITKLFERFIHASNEFIFHTPLPSPPSSPSPTGVFLLNKSPSYFHGIFLCVDPLVQHGNLSVLHLQQRVNYPYFLGKWWGLMGPSSTHDGMSSSYRSRTDNNNSEFMSAMVPLCLEDTA